MFLIAALLMFNRKAYDNVISDYLKHLDADSSDRENTESEFNLLV